MNAVAHHRRHGEPLSRNTRAALGIAALGLAGCAAGLALEPRQTFVSWLIAWWLVLGIALGSIAIVAVHRLTGGAWGGVLLRPLAAAASTMPIVAALAVPLVFATATLFPWARDDAAASELLRAKAWYLNVPFFWLRTALYLAVWTWFAQRLLRDLSGAILVSGAAVRRARAGSIATLIVYAVTITFAAIDWLMSLTPQWYSSTFGLLAALSQALCAFAFCVAWATLAPDSAARAASERDFQDLGNLLLTLAMTWAYLAFTQFLIVWSEDLPHEISWYVERRTIAWQAIAVVVAAVLFGLPLVAMLFRPLKRSRAVLGAVCAAVVAGGWLDVAWLVAPPFRTEGLPVRWTDAAALAAVGGIWFAWFCAVYAPHRRPVAARRAGPEAASA
jgi:hypothetical protein